MGYTIYVNKDRLDYILTSLSAVCESDVRFYSNGPQRWIGKAVENLPFCRLLQKSPFSHKMCTQSNEKANQRCSSSKKGFHYYCHAQMLEFMHPVWYEGIYVGNINIGQYRSRKRSLEDTDFQQYGESSGVELIKLKKAYYRHPVLDNDGINGTELLLEMCAQKLCEAGVFRIDYRDTINKVNDYITENLANNLSLAVVAEHIFMNPTYLSDMYHKATGITLIQYIQKARVDKAAYLVLNTTMSVAELSRAVGFKDPNYFAKVFRKEIGFSPREYRKKISTGAIIP